MTDLETIKKTLVNVSKGNDVLDMLMEFERTLDNVELFAYDNWILGELVEGPDISRYWFKTVWMYPYVKMPDPDGGLRLLKIGANISYKKGVFKKPVKVKGPQDWVDPETKKAKLAEHPVWFVIIELPIKFIDRGLTRIDDIIQHDIEKTNAELSGAFEQEVPEEAPQMGDEMPPDDQGEEQSPEGGL